jgi:hypothetical protein
MWKCVSSILINKLTLWWIDDLIFIFVNKLATVVLEADRQYSCNIRETDSEAKCLIWILSLQVITWSKIRLTADDFMLYKKTLSSLSQKTIFLSIFISKSTMYSSVSEKNMIILSLIKNAQEFDLQCRWIFNQLCEKLKENFSFALHKNKILRKMNHVFVLQ